MADAMEVSLASFVSLCAGIDYNLSSAEVAAIVSTIFLGIFVGGLFWGPVSDEYGRRPTFSAAVSLISLASMVLPFSPSYGMLLVFQLRRIRCRWSHGAL